MHPCMHHDPRSVLEKKAIKVSPYLTSGAIRVASFAPRCNHFPLKSVSGRGWLSPGHQMRTLQFPWCLAAVTSLCFCLRTRSRGRAQVRRHREQRQKEARGRIVAHLWDPELCLALLNCILGSSAMLMSARWILKSFWNTTRRHAIIMRPCDTAWSVVASLN